jgi:AraC-like DNA-binding protein
MIGRMAFSTSAFPEYREAINRTFVPLVATPLGSGGFRARLDAVGGRDLQVSTVRATAQQVRRTTSLIDDATDGYALVSIQVVGRSRVEQDGRAAELTPGTLVFCDSTRPFELTFDSYFEQVVVQVPRPAVSERALRRATAVPLDGSGPASVIAAFFRALAVQDPAAFITHGLGLIGSALTIAAGAVPHAVALDRERVLHHLRHAFRDPQLDAERVAQACHISRRALFRLFADTPLSLADELRRIRVAEAEGLLRAHPGRSVADIAPLCGFSSETQLRRAFRKLTGTTPGEYRSANSIMDARPT